MNDGVIPSREAQVMWLPRLGDVPQARAFQLRSAEQYEFHSLNGQQTSAVDAHVVH